jgi:glycosyltransferase involved in cell wall biosynthesis
VQWGYIASRAEYLTLLGQADLVVSTADHEFFGISVLEAMAAGAFPLLPNRLSYPELLPPSLRDQCLYTDETDLTEKTYARLSDLSPAPPALRQSVVARFDWPVVATVYDNFLAQLVDPS